MYTYVELLHLDMWADCHILRTYPFLLLPSGLDGRSSFVLFCYEAIGLRLGS